MKKILLGIGGLLFVLLSLWLGYYFYNQNNSDPTVYKTNKPFMTTIVKKTVATGAIVPRQEINIKPQVSGIVDQIFVEAGQIVKKGDRIARIKLVPSPTSINNAESSVELARIRLTDAKREAQRQRDVFGNKRDVEQAQYNYDNAVKEEQRQKTLFEDGIISERDYNQFALDVRLRKSQLDNARITSEGSLKQFETNVSIRQQELEAAINNLDLLRKGAAKKSGQVSNLIKSTVSGMILDISVKEGASVIERNNFNEGTTIASVADMKTLIFEGQVDESDVGKLKEGMPLELSIGALEDVKFDAALEHISPKGITEEGSVKFEIRAAIIPKEGIFLRAGYSASGDIILAKKENTIAIKERDVIFSGDSTFVEIQTGEQQFERKLVKLGLSDGIEIEVISGLDTLTEIKVLQEVGE